MVKGDKISPEICQHVFLRSTCCLLDISLLGNALALKWCNTHCKSFRSFKDPLHVQQMFFAVLAKCWSVKQKVSALLQKSIHEFMRKKECNVFDFFFLLSRIPNLECSPDIQETMFFFKNLLFKSLAAFGFLPLPKAYWPSAPLTRSLTPVDPLANASRRSSSALPAEIWLESTRSATLRLKCLLAGSPGAKSFCLLWRISKNLDRLGLKQEKATLDRLADNQHPTWHKIYVRQ